VFSLAPAFRRGQGRRSLTDRTMARHPAAVARDGRTSRPDMAEGTACRASLC